MLRDLLRRQSEYIGSHATERRAPKDECCTECDLSEPGTTEDPIVLAQCSICETWFCTPHFTMHEAPDGWDVPKPSWWQRALKVVRRG